MPKPTRDQIKKAVERELPGQEIAGQDRRRPERRAPAQGGTPSLDALQRKYARGVGAADARRPRKTGPLPDEDEIVLVRPKQPPDAISRGARPKAVVVDKSGRIVGRQG